MKQVKVEQTLSGKSVSQESEKPLWMQVGLDIESREHREQIIPTWVSREWREDLELENRKPKQTGTNWKSVQNGLIQQIVIGQYSIVACGLNLVLMTQTGHSGVGSTLVNHESGDLNNFVGTLETWHTSTSYSVTESPINHEGCSCAVSLGKTQ